MVYLEAPQQHFVRPDATTIFLAGGISGCPDWQTSAVAMLDDLDDSFVVVNPRRGSFDVGDESMSVVQVAWEHAWLHRVKAILFWFPCETLCPISLFELGAALERNWNSHDRQLLFVGTHPNYVKRFDVVKQIELMVNGDYLDIPVESSLEEVVKSLKNSLL